MRRRSLLSSQRWRVGSRTFWRPSSSGASSTRPSARGWAR